MFYYGDSNTVTYRIHWVVVSSQELGIIDYTRDSNEYMIRRALSISITLDTKIKHLLHLSLVF